MARLFILLICVWGSLFVTKAQNIYSVDPNDTLPIVSIVDCLDTIGGNKSLVHTFADKSVLAEGKWVKVRVKTSGVKCITKTALAKMGFSDMSSISVYGNGGYVLPLKVMDFRYDDLTQLPVHRTDDGIFFYAQDGKQWSYLMSTHLYAKCKLNEYDPYTYYYITDSKEPSPAPSVYSKLQPIDRTVDYYDARVHHELYSENILRSGRDWVGEKILGEKPSKTISLSLPIRNDNDTVFFECRVIGRSGSDMSYTLYYNDEEFYTDEFASVNTSSTVEYYGRSMYVKKIIVASDKKRNDFKITFKPNSTSDCIWLDYVTVSSRTNADMTGKDEMFVRTIDSYYNPNKKAELVTESDSSIQYVVNGAEASYIVWKISDYLAPQVMQTTFKDGKLSFSHPRCNVEEFVIFNSKGKFEEPEIVGEVPNQNLHGLSSVNYVIVYHRDFKQQAERLAELHRKYSGISVIAVDVEDIYNEFSSGRLDISAIRDFLNMLYRRGLNSENQLRNVLLFGDGSYDNKRSPDNTASKIPTYQSSHALYQSNSFVSDDFYAWLDDKEGDTESTSYVDIGVGRFPVQTIEEATIAVDKSERYLRGGDFGAWKNSLVFVADDGDKAEHISYSESIASKVEKKYPDATISRIYLETYAPERTSTGIIYPKAHEDFMSSINNGCLILNYVGHGGYNALTDEGLFKQKNIKEWTNVNKLPLFITATCDFCPFDHNNILSAGEEGFLYPHGGFLALYTTTRLVYGSSNNRLHKAVYTYLLECDAEGRRYTIGEALAKGKVDSRAYINSMKYILIGDPALTLDFGTENYVSTDEVNGEHIDICESPIAALKTNVIKGSVRNPDNSVNELFNGQVMITLHDKRVTKTMTGPISGQSFSYTENGSVLYSGIVNVVNGRFEVSFILSKDIDFEVGDGRVSYYAYSTDSIEASGALNTILVGGVSDVVSDDSEGPTIDMWIDYPEFVNGGKTGPNPIVYARIEDVSGINTSGLGIGHNLSICVDNDRENAINVNSNFVYDLGSFTSGTLSYQMPTLADGNHTISLKAWDNLNNSNSQQVEIISSVSTGISFGSIDLTPQPYYDDKAMKLCFTHNCGGGTINLTLRIYGLNGQLLTQSTANVIANGSMVDDINLVDVIPDIRSLSSGLYFLEVTAECKGRKGSFAKKIAIKAQ